MKEARNSRVRMFWVLGKGVLRDRSWEGVTRYEKKTVLWVFRGGEICIEKIKICSEPPIRKGIRSNNGKFILFRVRRCKKKIDMGNMKK